MTTQLEELIKILEEADALREARHSGDSERDPDETTAEDVMIALIKHGRITAETLRKRDRLTQLLRAIRPKP